MLTFEITSITGHDQRHRMRRLKFATGSLTTRECEALMNALPIEVTFVDRLDRIKYFNKPKDRIFARDKKLINSRIQKCHTKESLDMVEELISKFKSGAKDMAEFWKKEGERIRYSRYIAVRDEDGRYLGTLEATQDITEIKKIDGERRTLVWNES